MHNVSEIYKVPLLLKAQNVASIISTKLKMYLPKGMPNIQARRSECVCECVEAKERESGRECSGNSLEARGRSTSSRYFTYYF
jgi:CTP synthase (UTP-ammonia lyase)